MEARLPHGDPVGLARISSRHTREPDATEKIPRLYNPIFWVCTGAVYGAVLGSANLWILQASDVALPLPTSYSGLPPECAQKHKGTNRKVVYFRDLGSCRRYLLGCRHKLGAKWLPLLLPGLEYLFTVRPPEKERRVAPDFCF